MKASASTHELELRVFELPSELDALAPFAADWDRLVEVDEGAPPASSHAWSSAFFEHLLPSGARGFCVVALRDGQLVGVLPLSAQAHPILGSLAPVLRAPAHDHRPTGDAVLSLDGAEAVLRALVDRALEHDRNAVCVALRHLPARSLTHRLAPSLYRTPRVTVEPDGTGSLIPIRGSTLDAFRGRLSKNFASNLRKFHNKLKKSEHRFEFQIGAAADPAFLPAFMDLEGSGWKGQESTAIVSSPVLRGFYRDLVARFCARGWLQWNRLTIGDRVVAAHLGMRTGRRLYLWKVAYDESFAACAPGNLLFEKLVEHEFQLGELDEINYMTNTAFTKNWRLLPYDYHAVRVYSLGARSLLLGAAPDWGKRLARRLRQQVKP